MIRFQSEAQLQSWLAVSAGGSLASSDGGSVTGSADGGVDRSVDGDEAASSVLPTRWVLAAWVEAVAPPALHARHTRARTTSKAFSCANACAENLGATRRRER